MDISGNYQIHDFIGNAAVIVDTAKIVTPLWIGIIFYKILVVHMVRLIIIRRINKTTRSTAVMNILTLGPVTAVLIFCLNQVTENIRHRLIHSTRLIAVNKS